VVARADEEEGEDHAGGSGPGVEKHAGEKVGIAVCLDDQEVGLDVDGGEEEVEEALQREDHLTGRCWLVKRYKGEHSRQCTLSQLVKP
jgi:hypothetical protein